MTYATAIDPSGDLIVTVSAPLGSVNITTTKSPVYAISVTQGGVTTALPPGQTAYTTLTHPPMIVEFFSPPVVPPNPNPNTRCTVVFTSNPMCKPLPANPALSPNSAAWAALLFQAGHDQIGGISVGTQEESEPLDIITQGAALLSLPLDCSKESYSAYSCSHNGNPSGTMQTLPLDTYVSQGSDHHSSHDDPVAKGEYDYWLAPYPFSTTLTSWTVGGAGFCSWSGPGTGCSGSTATDIATSLGGVDMYDLSAAEGSANGSLPYALSVSALCADSTYVYPAVSSDGANTDTSSACTSALGAGARPPEGTRGYLALTDAQIDATTNAPYVKALLRTADEQHMGFTITDTNWSGAPGLSVAYRAQPFTAQGAEIGLAGNFTLPITTTGLPDLATIVRFCSNGSC